MVKPGTYHGRVRLRGDFSSGVVVKAQVPYESKLRNNATVVTCYYGRGICLEGFDIAHDGPGSGALVFQVQDLRGTAGDDDYTSRIVIRNNILHDSYNNDILKINNGAKEILVDGNLFYNQEGSDEHIDINSVEFITVQNNIFMNDFSGSGRINDNSTSSYIVIKDSNEEADLILGTSGVSIRKKIFMNWEGSRRQGFVRMGEDGKNYYEAMEITIQNNLMLGNSNHQIRSPVQIMNSKRITFRHNTIHGDLPAKEYGSRIFTYGTNPPVNDSITITANIWSDPTGTMGDVYNRGNNTTNLFFYRNLHWNGGQVFPTSTQSIIEVASDYRGLTGDPLLPGLSGLILPRYLENEKRFSDGSSLIAEVFRNIVLQYGKPGYGSPASDSADAAYSPPEDILGNPRDPLYPDIGAFEGRGTSGIKRSMAGTGAFYDPVSKTIRSYSAPIARIALFDSRGIFLETSAGMIDLSSYESGFYIAKGMKTNGKSFVLKFIHQ